MVTWIKFCVLLLKHSFSIIAFLWAAAWMFMILKPFNCLFPVHHLQMLNLLWYSYHLSLMLWQSKKTSRFVWQNRSILADCTISRLCSLGCIQQTLISGLVNNRCSAALCFANVAGWFYNILFCFLIRHINSSSLLSSSHNWCSLPTSLFVPTHWVEDPDGSSSILSMINLYLYTYTL